MSAELTCDRMSEILTSDVLWQDVILMEIRPPETSSKSIMIKGRLKSNSECMFYGKIYPAMETLMSLGDEKNDNRRIHLRNKIVDRVKRLYSETKAYELINNTISKYSYFRVDKHFIRLFATTYIPIPIVENEFKLNNVPRSEEMIRELYCFHKDCILNGNEAIYSKTILRVSYTETFQNIISLEELFTGLEMNIYNMSIIERESFCAKLALSIYWLHIAGLVHNDMHEGNILVTIDNEDIKSNVLIDPTSSEQNRYKVSIRYNPRLFDYDQSIFLETTEDKNNFHERCVDYVKYFEHCFKILSHLTMEQKKAIVYCFLRKKSHDTDKKIKKRYKKLRDKFIRLVCQSNTLPLQFIIFHPNNFTDDDLQMLFKHMNMNISKLFQQLNLDFENQH